MVTRSILTIYRFFFAQFLPIICMSSISVKEFLINDARMQTHRQTNDNELDAAEFKDTQHLPRTTYIDHQLFVIVMLLSINSKSQRSLHQFGIPTDLMGLNGVVHLSR